MDQNTGDAGEPVRVAQQRALLEPGCVREVVRADPYERELRSRRPGPHPEPGPPCTTSAGLPSGFPQFSQ
jgi:hypothetical protein